MQSLEIQARERLMLMALTTDIAEQRFMMSSGFGGSRYEGKETDDSGRPCH
jgi:hypothetical protein